MKRLVVNADDFGFTRDVNAGIVEAHRKGILTATTLMAAGGAFDDAVALARQTPSLDVGCHLVLTQLESAAEPGRRLPSDVPALFSALLSRRVSVYDELKAQIARIIGAGIRPTHLDTHKHTHVLPAVLRAVARLSEEFEIPWIRRPFDIPLGYGESHQVRLASRAIRMFQSRFQPLLHRHGCRSTDYFAGFAITGRFHSADLVRLFDRLPAGSTELMCHPGFCTEELRAARTRLKESRVRELEALTAPETRAALVRNHIELTNYRNLL